MGKLDQGEHLALDLVFQVILRDFQIIPGLQVEPELGGGAESTRQAQGGIGCDTAPALNDGIDAVWGNPQGTRQGVLADAQRLEELFQQNLTGMDGRNFAGHVTPLVIVNNFNLVGVSVLPDKAQAIAVVDADAVLSFTVATQFLQTVAGGYAQVVEAYSGVQDEQFAQGRALQIGGQVRMAKSFEKIFCVAVAKGLDHILSISCDEYHVNQDGC